MKRSAGVILGLGLLGLSGCGGSGGSTPPSGGNQRGILFQVQPGTDVAALAREYGLTIEDSVPTENLYRFRGGSGEDEHSLSERLRRDPRCADAETDDGVRAPEGGSVTGDPIHVPFDFVTPTDSRYVSLSSAYTGSGSINPSVLSQINLTATRATHRATAVTVAVLDTGVQANHPSLSARLAPGYNAITPTAAPDDLPDGTQNTALGHGTMVAGVIAQVAPEARILPIRVLNADGSGSVFNVVRGLRWAIAHGANVINLSFGTPTASRTLEAALQDARKAGVVVVASAGNAGKEQKDYPAGFSNALAVAAVDATDHKTAYSNYGTHISLSAPGTGITSTYVGGGFATWSGTSFATPLVSGAAARLKALNPTWDPSKVGQALTQSARDINDLNPDYTGKLGKGVLNVAGALAEK